MKSDTRFILAAGLLACLLGGGATAEELRPRSIRGGEPATVYDYPFVVAIGGELDDGSISLCAGTLIADRWVLTAAHCVDALTEWDLAVVHGYPDYTEYRGVERIEMHPDFDPLVALTTGDIALIRLEEKFLSRTARTVALAPPELDGFLRPGVQATAVGWGGENPETMTQARWNLIDCSGYESEHLCAYGLGTAGETGDSGGPLLMDLAGETLQVGVASHAHPETGAIFYVPVAAYREWIDETLASEPPPDDACAVEPVDPAVVPQVPGHVPPPFQPESVDVALGEHGGTVTLMTADGDGYTLYGQPFAGGEIKGNGGRRYMVDLGPDGIWTAAYVPDSQSVQLGDDGRISLVRGEDGTWRLGSDPVLSGHRVTTESGRVYRLMVSYTGAWSATEVDP